MSVLYLLDTNVVLHLIRGKSLGHSIVAQYGLDAHAPRPLVSIVTHGELEVIARRNAWGPAKRATLQQALQSLATVDIHHPTVIDGYAEIDVVSAGRNMGKNDVWIAACAKAAGATLLTLDKDFDHLPAGLVAVTRVEVSETG